MSDIQVRPCERWVRAVHAGRTVLDTRRAVYVYVPGKPYPTYWVPLADIDPASIVAGERAPGTDVRGPSVPHAVRVGSRVAAEAFVAWPDAGVLADHVELMFEPFDAVLEEDEQVWAHPRDPRHRVDALPSRRKVEVWIGGERIAASERPVLLFETTLPTRYYLPQADVRMDLLVPSPTRTTCAYKGFASYWSVEHGGQTWKDLVWGYPAPFAGALAIAGRLCFYNERVELVVDGKPA